MMASHTCGYTIIKIFTITWTCSICWYKGTLTAIWTCCTKCCSIITIFTFIIACNSYTISANCSILCVTILTITCSSDTLKYSCACTCKTICWGRTITSSACNITWLAYTIWVILVTVACQNRLDKKHHYNPDIYKCELIYFHPFV